MPKITATRKSGRALPSDFADAVKPDGIPALAVDSDEAWSFAPVTFAPSKTGGADRGYADRVKTAVADATKIDRKGLVVSVKRTGDKVNVTVWRKNPTVDPA